MERLDFIARRNLILNPGQTLDRNQLYYTKYSYEIYSVNWITYSQERDREKIWTSDELSQIQVWVDIFTRSSFFDLTLNVYFSPERGRPVVMQSGGTISREEVRTGLARF